LDKLTLQEVAYQTFFNGVGATLSQDNKALWSPFPFHIGASGIKDVKEETIELKSLVSFHFGEEIFRRHDPLNVVGYHCLTCKYMWPFQNEV
jgi:hypothetical protein